MYLKIKQIKQPKPVLMSFFDIKTGEICGEFNLTEDGEFTFEGNVQESAQVFLNFLKPFVENYIKSEIKKRSKKTFYIDVSDDIMKGL